MPVPVITRFAPSPTGLLHLGHAYSGLLNHDLARKAGGAFRLRIEDIDQTRCRPGFETAIHDDLAWLGMTADGEILRQSDRMEIYQDALTDLNQQGLLYRCFKTRAELNAAMTAPHAGTVMHSATGPLPQNEEERLIKDGLPFAWRLDAKRAANMLREQDLSWTESDDQGREQQHTLDLSQLQDEVLARKDVPTSYHLASVVDDAAQGVTLVWRGEDLKDAVLLHRVLQSLLGLPEPLYRHHRLITDEQGRRLAKRDKAATLQSMRATGARPQQVRQQLGLPLADETTAPGANAQSPKGV